METLLLHEQNAFDPKFKVLGLKQSREGRRGGSCVAPPWKRCSPDLSLSPHQLSQSRPSLLVGSTSIHRNYYSSLKKGIPLSRNQPILNQEAIVRPYSDILTIQCMISSWASWNAHKIHVLELQTTNMVIFGSPLKISNALV